MKPSHSILDSGFNYVPSHATSVADTWRRFGWMPAAERQPATRIQLSIAASGAREAVSYSNTSALAHHCA